MNSINHGLVPVSGKEYKLFLVEVDDDNRERVLAGRVTSCEINVEPEYADVHVGYADYPVARYKSHEHVTITMNMVPSNGTYFTIEDFREDEDEGSQE